MPLGFSNSTLAAEFCLILILPLSTKREARDLTANALRLLRWSVGSDPESVLQNKKKPEAHALGFFLNFNLILIRQTSPRSPRLCGKPFLTAETQSSLRFSLSNPNLDSPQQKTPRHTPQGFS